MTIYVGEISHKPSADHLAGQVRHLDGATDNNVLAAAFGVTGFAGSISNNGKISMIDLFPSGSNGTIYVDPNELSRVDDLDFIQQHLNIITNWSALVRYMYVEHHSELQMALTDISSLANFNSLTNSAQIAVAKYFFDIISQNEVKKILNEQTEDAKFHDELGRNILGLQQSLNFDLHGLSFNFGIKTTCFDLSTKQVKINFKIEYARVNGSVRQIKGANASNQVIQFKFFKQKVTELIGKGTNDIKTSFVHKFDNNAWSAEIINGLRDKVYADFDVIKHQIKTHLTNLTPQDAKLNEFEEYNVATAVNRLWSELRFPLGEITTGNIDMDSIKKWYQKEISIDEFLKINQAAFINKLQRALASRFEPENVDYDAYINRAIEYVRDDLRGIKLTKIVNTAQVIAEKDIDDYANSFYQINDLDELMNIYHASNRIHDMKIIQSISKDLVNKINDNDDVNPDLKAKVENYFDNNLPAFVIERYQIFLQNNFILLNSSMDQQLAKKYLEKNLGMIVTQTANSIQRLNILNIDDFLKQKLHELQKDIDEFFEDNFDSVLALCTARQNIYDNLIKMTPYSKVNSEYWINKLQNISSYDDIKIYQNANNIEQFVDHFAPEFEDVLQQETTISWDEVITNINKNRNNIYQKVIDDIFQEKVEKELSSVDKLPTSIQDTLNNWYIRLTNKVDDDIDNYNNSFKLYPDDTIDSLIQKFINQEKIVIVDTINKLNWDKLQDEFNELLSEKESDIKAVKQRLINIFNGFIHDESKMFPLMQRQFFNELQSHQITKPILSFKQNEKCDFYLDQFLSQIQAKFDAEICQENDLNEILNGDSSYEDFIRQYLIELSYSEIVNSIINWDELTRLAHDEIVEDLIDDTGKNSQEINDYINANYSGELVNSIKENDYQKIVSELSDASNEPDEDVVTIAKDLMTNCEFAILENEWPENINEVSLLINQYADKNDFIDENIDELHSNTIDDFQEYLLDNSDDNQQDKLDMAQLEKWLQSKPLSYLIDKSDYENPIVITTADEIINQYK